MIVEPVRERDCDVLVCGGGTAGVAAAVAAARTGAHTILMERHGFCGGICVGSLVHTLDGLRNCRNYDQYVVGGVGREIVATPSFSGITPEVRRRPSRVSIMAPATP